MNLIQKIFTIILNEENMEYHVVISNSDTGNLDFERLSNTFSESIKILKLGGKRQ